MEDREDINKSAQVENINENIDFDNTFDNINDLSENTSVELSKDNSNLDEIKKVENNISLDKNIALEENNQNFQQETKVNDLITVRPVKFQEFKDLPPLRTIKKNLDILQDVSMHVSVELGKTKSTIKEVMALESGSIVELDKVAGEQVEIYVNDKLVAKGEVIVIEDKFGVRVTSTNIGKKTK